MTKMRKIICLLLVFALCFAVGCSKQPTTKEPVNTNPPVVDDYVSDRELAEKEAELEGAKDAHTVTSADFGDLTGYQIVYPKGNEQLRQAANKLAAYLAENEITAEVVSDDAAKKDKEMLIGDTNRMKSDLADNKYAVTVEGDKLFFQSGNFNGAIKAVLWFISLDYEKGKVNTLEGEYEFTSELERPDGKYVFVWGDEFDGNALDAAKWELTTAISAESSFKLSRDPEVLKVEDGILKLSAKRWLDPDNNQIQAIAPYTVESKAHMNFQYGYMEMRAMIPLRAGAWPSLWLSGACSSGAVVSSLFPKGDIKKANFSAEFDIIEYTSLEPNLHKWFYDDTPVEGVDKVVNAHSSLGAVQSPVKSDLRLDAKQSFVYQTIGFDWTPEELVIYINGQEHLRYNWKKSVQLDGFKDMTDFLNPVFVRLNNHLLPSNFTSDFSTLPADFYIDYVRLYQKPGTGGIWLAE